MTEALVMATGLPWLSLLLATPLLAALAVTLLDDAGLARRVALFGMGIELLLALVVFRLFDPAHVEPQLLESHAWIPSLSAEYLLGVDGISVIFLPLAALLVLSLSLSSGRQPLPRLYWVLLLVLESATMGVFCALDLVLFFLFWEIGVIPIFFLLGLWGVGAHRRMAALKYALYMLASGVPLLFAFVLLALNHASVTGGALSFSLPELLQTPMAAHLQGSVFLLLVLGFAVKTPLLPFHGWLPSVALEGPPSLGAFLLGLKLGAYGLLRLAVPLAPQAAQFYSWMLGIVGAMTLVYGALLALRQSNFRRLLAYTSISHVGLVVVGIAALDKQGFQGALLQLANFNLVASSLMLLAGFVQRRLGGNELVHLGGLAQTMPRMAVLLFWFAFAAIGLPGSGGFPAELLLLLGALGAHPGLGIAALLGAVLGTAGLLGFVRLAFWGPLRCPETRRVADLQHYEWAALAIPALLVLVLGLYPNAILQVGSQSVDAWLARLKP